MGLDWEALISSSFFTILFPMTYSFPSSGSAEKVCASIPTSAGLRPKEGKSRLSRGLMEGPLYDWPASAKEPPGRGWRGLGLRIPYLCALAVGKKKSLEHPGAYAHMHVDICAWMQARTEHTRAHGSCSKFQGSGVLVLVRIWASG